MLEPNLFIKEENENQYKYIYKNEITKERIQIIRYKTEEHWWGTYEGNEQYYTIPVFRDESSYAMLQKICDWYNNKV